MSKIKVKIVVIALFMMFVIFLVVSLYFLRETTLIDRSITKIGSEIFLRDNNINVEEIENCFDKRSENINLKSRHGHSIPVKYVLADESYDNITVVLVHGHEMNLISLYPIADFFIKKGINVVLYDQRAHGDNTAKNVTFGYCEKDDLGDVVGLVLNKMKVKKPIGLLGQSMGAATCGFYIGQENVDKYIKFAVLDCPYNNMKSVIEVAAKKRGYSDIITKVLLKNLNICNRIYLGFWYGDMDVCKSIKNSNVPVLMYAMEQDRTCPIEMAEDIFSNIKHNNKEIVKFKDGRHILGFYKERDIYTDKLLSFINKYGK